MSTSKKISNKNMFDLSFEERSNIAKNIRIKYPNRIPIIIIPINITIAKQKFLSPKDITIHQFLFSVRKSITNIKSTEALFLFIDNTIQNGSTILSEIDNVFCSKDGFIYITISKESTFG